MQYIILGLMRHGEARHGYALVKEYNLRTGFRISVGHVYRELQRLLAKGWVDAVTNPPGADPRRLPYVITSRGAAAFDTWLASHASVVPPECHDELAVRAFFVSANAAASTKGTLDLWKDELSVHRQVCERLRDDAFREPNTDGAASSLRVLLLGRRLQHIAADIAFVDAVRSSCKDGREAPSTVRTRPPRARSRPEDNTKHSSAR
jgi:DNA-binding PadR family transcriptional regulator